MPNIVYVAMSLDGFIAKKDGSVDWLDEIPNPLGIDYGFSEFMERTDALVMGRNTYEKVLSFKVWPYKKKVFVLSNSLKEVDISLKDKASIVKGDLKKIISTLNNEGYNSLYIDGGVTVQSFLEQDLIDEIIITNIPVILGSGIPLFSDKGKMLKIKHCSSCVFENGLVQSRYIKV